MCRFLVTGATGRLGGAIITHLLKKGVDAKEIAVLVRDEEKGAKLKDLGVTIKIGDYNDEASLRKAFEGIEKLMFVSSPDFDNTLRISQHANVVKAARDAKVSHILYTGIAYAEDMNVVGLQNVHLATEYMIKTTGISYTFLRNGFYLENITGELASKAVSNGTLITAAGSGSFNFVLIDDLGLAAASAIVGEGHENKIYNLVNSRATSFDEYADILSRVSKKQVTHVSLEPSEAVEKLISMGEPEAVAGFNVYGLYLPIAEGQFSKVSMDLEQLIGRSCTSIEEALNKVFS